MSQDSFSTLVETMKKTNEVVEDPKNPDEEEDRKLIEEVVDEVVEDKVEEALEEEPQSEDLEKSDDEYEEDESMEKTEDEVKEDPMMDLVNAVKELTSMIADLRGTMTKSEGMYKTLSTKVETLSRAPVGKRSVTQSVTPAKPIPPTADEVLAKSLTLRSSGKLTDVEVVVIDESVKRGLGIPAQFSSLFV